MSRMVPLPSPGTVNLGCESDVNLTRRDRDGLVMRMVREPRPRRLRGPEAAATVLTGIRTVTTSPSPGVETAETVPPWAVTMAATIDSPSPLPPRVRARAGSAR